MAADSDSKVAWHRAQLRKNRETLKQIETARFITGEDSDPRALHAARRRVTELKAKIRQSEQVIAEHDRLTRRRPLATDFRSLTSTHWGTWNANGPSSPADQQQ